MTAVNTTEEKIKYSELLSSLFCSVSIFTLSILCLLNNLSLDFYCMIYLLKIVIPASVSFWILGYVIGKILDKYNTKIVANKKNEETKAYEIPSIFSDNSVNTSENDLGGE